VVIAWLVVIAWFVMCLLVCFVEGGGVVEHALIIKAPMLAVNKSLNLMVLFNQ